ncbi:MAG: tRNA pseudouridine(38-40) synthase TruA [Thermoplasmatales archaeon]|nr:tRNA pseudouridine(38-40) synthase TruA [Thermoplasmatales archaeon]
MRIALKFAYDGRKFHGYARQPQLKTIEGEIIKSLIKHGFIEDTKESCIRSASRTDKGVSALGNVIAFNTDSYKERIFQEMKEDLTDILVYGIKDVEQDFYPRYAKRRTYRYYLKNENFEIDEVLSAAASFAGEYNFSNFARTEEFKDPVRTIDNIIVTNQDDFLIMDFYAQTFLWNQVRRIVSAIQKMGKSKIEKEQIIEALHNPNKKVDFGLAPAEPLILRDIVYDFEFEYDKKLLNSLKDFEKNIVSSF